MARQHNAPARFPALQTTLLVVGALYLVWGIVGFFFLGNPATDLAGNDTGHGALGLETNALQNLVHVAIGLVAMVGTSNETAMRVGSLTLLVTGIGLAALGVLGLARPEANFFSQNLPVVIVHAVGGLVGLAVAVLPMPTPEGQASGPPHP